MPPRPPGDRHVGNATIEIDLSALRPGDGLFDAQDFLGSHFSAGQTLDRALCKRVGSSVSGLTTRRSPRVTTALLESLMDDLNSLEAKMSEQIESVQLAVDTESASTHTRIMTTERALKQYLGSVSMLEQQADELVSFGRRVGVPFSDLRERSVRAKNAAAILENLIVFSTNADVSMLPEVYHDDSRVEEASEVVRGLMESIERVCDVETEGEHREASASGSEIGSIFNAYSGLLLYLNILDNRIVNHFDAAVDSKDVTCMAYYKRVMDKLHGSSGNPLLGSRYVSRRGVFVAPDDVLGDRSTRCVTDVCSRLSEYVRHEQAVIEQVFGERDGSKVMGMLIARIFEETLADFLAVELAHLKKEPSSSNRSDGGLVISNPNPKQLSDRDRDHVMLISDSCRRVHGLADEALRLFPHDYEDASLTADELVEAAMGPALDLYEELELRWHMRVGRSLASGTRMGSSSTSSRHTEAISTDVALDLISMNEESVQRCILVKRSPSSLIQRLFCSPALREGLDSSLLDYVSTYIERQMSSIVEESNKSLATAAIWTMPASVAPRAEDELLVDQFVEASFARVAACASTASEIVELVRNHYARDIEHHLDSTASLITQRSLQALQKAVEHHVAATLQCSIDALALKIRDMLYVTQQKSDFLLDASGNVATTPSCQRTCVILTAVSGAMAKVLSPVNMNAFSQALQAKIKETLEQHILRYYYSREGGLRLKSDLSAYGACLKGRGASDLIALTNLLIVEDQAVNEVSVGLSYFSSDRVARWVKRRV